MAKSVAAGRDVCNIGKPAAIQFRDAGKFSFQTGRLFL